jgi:hypothetical protein
MSGSLELFFSVSAMLISAGTTYFTVWNVRYFLGATTTKVNLRVQSASSKNADEPVEASYRIFAAPRIIFTHRGTRPVVVTKIALVRPQTAGAEEVRIESFGDEKSYVFQPGNVLEAAPEFALPILHNDFEQFREHWNLAFTVVDHRGRRSDPQIPLFVVTYRLTPRPNDPEAAPELSLDFDFQRKPMPVVKSGWLVNWA